MKIYYLLTLLIIQVSTFASSTILVVGANNIYPLMWAKNKKNYGYGLTAAEEVLNKLNLKYQIQTYPWARCQAIAKNKGAIITGFSKTKEREEHFYFTESFMDSEIYLIVKSGSNLNYQKIEDLKGLRIGKLRGSSFGDEFNRLGTVAEFVEDDSNEQRLEKLSKNRIDIAIFAQSDLESAKKKSKLYHIKLEKIPKIFFKDSIYFGIGKNNESAKELVKKMNPIILKLKNNGRFKQLKKEAETIPF